MSVLTFAVSTTETATDTEASGNHQVITVMRSRNIDAMGVCSTTLFVAKNCSDFFQCPVKFYFCDDQRRGEPDRSFMGSFS